MVSGFLKMVPSADPAQRHPTAEGDAWPDVTIGVIAALSVEGAAMRALLDDPLTIRCEGDPNEYRVGHLDSVEPGRPHRIVLVTLPEDNNRNAASTCTDMLRSFPHIRCVIMAGIAGGVPAPDQPQRHVRLGDVVLAIDGVIDYGHTREGPSGAEQRRPIGGVSMELKRAAQHVQQDQILGRAMAWHRLFIPAGDYPMAVFARPPESEDLLHRGRRVVPHPDRELSGHPKDYPKIHFGVIGCADKLLKSAARRDELVSRYRVLAFEMEAAGVAAGVANRGLTWFVVRGIVDYCDEYKNDIWHAYASLAAAACVRGILAQCPPYRVVWRVATTGVRTLLPESEIDRLRLLLAEAPGVDGLTVWHAAVDGLVPPPAEPATLGELAARLAEQNAGPDGMPPLVALAEQVAARVRHRLASELRAWTDRVGQQFLHLEPDRIQAYRRRAEQAQHERSADGDRPPIVPCLLFQIERDGIEEDSCEVRYWIQRQSEHWQPEPGKLQQATFADLERVLQAAIQRAESMWSHVGDQPVEIELLLPGDLLHTAVEWWHTELDGPAPMPLCVDYRVVVRSLDRMRAEHRHRHWNNRWRRMWQRPPQHRVYLGRPEPDPAGFAQWNTRLRDDSDVTTVILGSSPEDESGSRELQSALNAGIPVILWDHRPGPVTPETAALLNGLTEGPPGETADRVWHLRRAAALLSEEDRQRHPGRHVALLWDDPDRNVYGTGAPR